MDHLAMSSCLILCSFLRILLLGPSLAHESSPQKVFGGKVDVPSFVFSWLDDKAAFQAGDTATIKIKLLELPLGKKAFDLVQHSMSFSLSISGKKGNSSYISSVHAHLEGDPTFWNISFVPIRIGDFTIIVAEDHFGISYSSLQFTVTPGHVHPSACLASWMDYGNFVAGTKAFLLVLPKDAFGNNITRGTNMPSNEFFALSGSYENGTLVELLDFRYNGWNEAGYLSLEFVPIVSGNLLVQVQGGNVTLRDSPLSLIVKPGPLDMGKTIGKWKHGTTTLQIFSKIEIFIYQQDAFGNPVPDHHPFDARVVEQVASNLSVPVIDLLFEEVADGVQLLSFTAVEPGKFVLAIFDAQQNKKNSTMTYEYTVFIGYCDGSKSFANGSGLAHSTAGVMSSFMVFLEDQYQNPSPIEAARLQVQILGKNGTSSARTIIFPLTNPNETNSVAGQTNFALELPENNYQSVTANSTAEASHFNVSYTPERSEEYEIRVLCGNIPINNGNPYIMTVSPGIINTSLSGVLTFAPSVKRFNKNEVVALLVDSFMNPIVGSQSKLSFQLKSANITSFINTTSFATWEFVDNNDGSYVGYYLARNLGSYNICVSFENQQLAPCPFEIYVRLDEYFSAVHNDSISVWEDESVSFDVLSNDYIAGSQAKTLNASTPLHGTLLQHGQLFRYTPFEGFFGNDSFSYTISDINNNVVTATVFIYVLCRPPQFVSLPDQLHVTEDTVGPKFGGFPGLEILYSDTEENITVMVKAWSGSIFLAPMSMYLHQQSDGVLSVSRGGRAGKDLILAGNVQTINGALQLLQYLGNKDFYGNDVITFRAMNKNGIQDAQLPIFVEPINDPPIVHAPKSIFLGGKDSSEGFQIFDKQRDSFEFSVVEPDLLSFPGNKSHLLLVFSLEVTEGTLSMLLPVSLIATTELKTKSNNHWQSLQTYVTIANRIALRGTGIRFHGTVLECNNAMQRIFYQGSNHDTTMTVTINDLGNYGCYPDCSEMMSSPLSSETTVHLIKRKPMNSTRALLVGSVIAIEILTMLGLGGVLLYFLLKCMKALKGEQRDTTGDETFTSTETPTDQNMNISPSQDAAHASGRVAIFSISGNGSNFRQRSCRGSRQEQELQPFSQPNSDDHRVVHHAIGKDN